MGKPKKERKKITQGPLLEGEYAILTIDDINHEGQGIGHHEGLTVFVSQTIPGDRVKIKVHKRLQRYAVGEVVEWLKPSSDRIEPDCVYAQTCGGCSLQQMAYPAQLRHKQNLVSSALQRIGKVENAKDLMRPILGMDSPWHYRSKVQLPVAGSWQNPEIGFFASHSHVVVDALTCPVQPTVCDALRETLRQHLRAWRIDPYREEDAQGLLRHLIIRMGFATGNIMVVLVLNGDGIPEMDHLVQNFHNCIRAMNESEGTGWDLRSVFVNINRKRTNVILGSEFENVYGEKFIEEKILGLTYRISPATFFQVNPAQTETLYQTVLELADLKGHEQVLDLYCGTGSISLLLAQKAGWVLGVESVEAAIADAIVNADINGITNAEFTAGKTEDVLPQWMERGLHVDVVVLDPPRKGCDERTLKTLVDLSAERLIYVSCNPATLARDLYFLGEHDYRVKEVQAVDLFPHTSHVECVVLMSRIEK